MDRQETLFRQWLDEHKGLMYKICRLYADNQEDREDLLQQMLYQVWVSIPSFKEQAKASTWVYKVALNTALTWRRGENKRPRHRALLSLHELPQEPPAAGSPDAEDRELLQTVYACVCKLPKIDCALALLYLNGLKYEQMADILGISPGNVGVRLNRIRKTLAEMMKDREDGH